MKQKPKDKKLFTKEDLKEVLSFGMIFSKGITMVWFSILTTILYFLGYKSYFLWVFLGIFIIGLILSLLSILNIIKLRKRFKNIKFPNEKNIGIPYKNKNKKEKIDWIPIILYTITIIIFTYLLFWKNLLNLPNIPIYYFVFKSIIWITVTDCMLRMGNII